MNLNKNFFRKLFYYFLFIFLIFFFIIIVFLIYLKIEFEKPLSYNKEDIVIEIPKGSNSKEIFSILKNKNIIDNKILYYFSVIYKGDMYVPKYGEYLISKNYSISEVLDIINSGNSIHRKITVPEGLTTKEIIDVVLSNQYLKGEIEGDIQNLEGMFLPETYFFYNGYSRNDLLNRMKNEMEKTLEEKWNMRNQNLPYVNKIEALILASIIESETGAAPERKMIASVFVNRLRKNMKLQSDPTVVYGLEKNNNIQIKKLKRSHLKIDHQWNTYTRNGLPKSPICNPGEKSIEAVMKPLNTDYLYFVADEKGGHLFARSLNEHNKNILYIKKNKLLNLNDNKTKNFSDDDLPLSKPSL